MTTKKIKTSDILGDNYYIYELTSSNYTPALNGSITITCIMKDVYGTVASGKSITLYQNGTSKGAQTTNSSGVATWSITCSNAGIQSFKVGNKAIEVFVDNKEDKSNKVTSLSESSTNAQYPSAKTMYDELMTVRTVTPPTHIIGISATVNNVTKNESLSHINSYDLEYFEKIVYNINFEDNDFQMFFQQGSNDSNIQIIYFDGNDCYWGEADDNTGDLTQGSLICEGNTIQATLNKNKTITIGNTIVNWKIDGEIVMFGNVDFTYTIYSHKYLDTDFPYTFIYGDSSMVSAGDYTVNSITKDSGGIYLSTDLDNAIEKIYTITFNDDDFSYLDYGDIAIYFDGTDCYWGQWDEDDYDVLNKRTLICDGNVVQATYLSGNGNSIYFPDGESISNMDYSLSYFGDVNIKVKNKVLALEYVSNKTLYLTDSFDDSICYPSIATLKDYAEDKSNKVTSWSNTLSDVNYPSEKLVKDSLDGKQDELVSGTNLKTLNEVDLLGEGDITIDVSCGSSNVLFEDDATTDKSSNYSGCITFRNTQSCMGLTYESNNTRYKLTENGSKAHNLHIIPLDGYKNIKIEYDFYLDSSYYYYGFIAYKDGNDNVTWNLSHNELFKGQTTNGSYSETIVKSVSDVTGKWLHYEITVSNKELTMKLYKDNSLYHTETWTLSDTIWNDIHYGFVGWGNTGDKIAYFKNLKVEGLGGGSTTIFEDTGSASGVSNYSTAHLLETGGITTFTLTWDTTENAYHIESTTQKAVMLGIDALDGYTGDFKLEADIMRKSTSDGGGLCYCQKEKYGFFYGLQGVGFVGHHYVNGIWQGELNPTGSSSANVWYHFELVKEGTTITISAYDSTGVTLLASTSKTYTDDENYFGFPMSDVYFKNVKVISLEDSENTIYLGDDIMTMIDTALGHIITNWEDYD